MVCNLILIFSVVRNFPGVACNSNAMEWNSQVWSHEITVDFKGLSTFVGDSLDLPKARVLLLSLFFQKKKAVKKVKRGSIPTLIVTGH